MFFLKIVFKGNFLQKIEIFLQIVSSGYFCYENIFGRFLNSLIEIQLVDVNNYFCNIFFIVYFGFI